MKKPRYTDHGTGNLQPLKEVTIETSGEQPSASGSKTNGNAQHIEKPKHRT